MISRANYGYISRQVWPAGLNVTDVTRALGYSVEMHLIGYIKIMFCMPFSALTFTLYSEAHKKRGSSNFLK